MIDPTRESAWRLLSAVLDEHRSLDEALDALPTTSPRDRAAAHRLAATVLRRLGSLDAAIAPFLRREPPSAVRHILRLGAAGLLLLEAPPHAAVGTAVALARVLRLDPFAALVNAVLRRLAEAGPAALADLDAPRLDTPAWLWNAWGSDARAIAAAHQAEAPLDLTLKTGAALDGVALPTGSVRRPAGTRPTELPGFAEGAFWVQDAAAALPARLLAARPGEHVADLCAAPGGKTAQLADAGAVVTAVDRDPGRLERLRANMARLRLPCRTVLTDALVWRPDERLDGVLLDAPCTATGTIRRHPDILHLKRERDAIDLARGQDRLLEAAASMLRPGGCLVYAVCSMLPVEGEKRAEAALRGVSLRPDPIRADEVPGLEAALTAAGHLRTLPSMWPQFGGLDGFFVARFRRAD